MSLIYRIHPLFSQHGSSGTGSATTAEYQRITIEKNVDGIQVVTLNDNSLREHKIYSGLEDELERFVKQNLGKIVLNLSNVNDLTSSGIRVLIVFRKMIRESEQRFAFCCSTPSVVDIFKTTTLFTEGKDYFTEQNDAIGYLSKE